jgi:lipoprotein-anchoring transpeptidase ErfK/SrfK
MNTFDVGDAVRISLVCANSAGTAIDPTTLTLTVKPALGTATTYTYGVGVTIVKDSTGNYHADYTVLTGSGGMVYYKWTATGSYVGMAQSAFAVRVDDAA